MARKRSKKGTEKRLNLQCKQCTREEEAEVGGTEERIPTGVYRNPSTAARVERERIVRERDSRPGTEARKEEKGKRKAAKATPEFAGFVKTVRIAANFTKGSWNRNLNAVDDDKTSERKCVKMKVS